MIKITKQNFNKKYYNYKHFNSFLGNILIFFIDKVIKIPKNVKIKILKKKIKIKGYLGLLNLDYLYKIMILLKKTNKILISFIFDKSLKKKKEIIYLYNSLIKIKIKGILQGYKIDLFLKGLGYKSFIKENFLILKVGFSHNIFIKIPKNIKILNKNNKILFYSIDKIKLTNYIFYIKNLKKPEPYKGKGILLKNENILRKEGKRNKK